MKTRTLPPLTENETTRAGLHDEEEGPDVHGVNGLLFFIPGRKAEALKDLNNHGVDALERFLQREQETEQHDEGEPRHRVDKHLAEGG